MSWNSNELVMMSKVNCTNLLIDSTRNSSLFRYSKLIQFSLKAYVPDFFLSIIGYEIWFSIDAFLVSVIYEKLFGASMVSRDNCPIKCRHVLVLHRHAYCHICKTDTNYNFIEWKYQDRHVIPPLHWRLSRDVRGIEHGVADWINRQKTLQFIRRVTHVGWLILNL